MREARGGTHALARFGACHRDLFAAGCILLPRQIRIEYPGAIYHLLNRGDRREAIFRDDGDCHDFITIRDYCPRTAALGLEGGGLEPAAQNRFRKGGYCRAAAGGDDHDPRADSAEAENGNSKHLKRKLQERKGANERAKECKSMVTPLNGKMMGKGAGGHFSLAGRRGKRMICGVTRKQTKAQKIWAEEKASGRKSKPSRIWVRLGLSALQI
jgi:hypothetical protein